MYNNNNKLYHYQVFKVIVAGIILFNSHSLTLWFWSIITIFTNKEMEFLNGQLTGLFFS